jgi:hypothetical protein
MTVKTNEVRGANPLMHHASSSWSASACSCSAPAGVSVIDQPNLAGYATVSESMDSMRSRVAQLKQPVLAVG